MNETLKKVLGSICIIVLLLSSGFCAGYFISQRSNKEYIERADKLIGEATATSLAAAKKLEESARIISEFRHDNLQLERENKAIRDAIASGLAGAGELAGETERSLALVELLQKLVDIASDN